MGALVAGRRYCAAPRLHQPLSHAASRRDSSPFRGAKGWAEACGVCASIYHDADTYVSLPPVRGGVLDAPRPRDCRGGWLLTLSVADFTRVTHGAPGSVYCPTYAISRAQPAHHFVRARRLVGAPDQRRPSSYGRGVEDAAPYGGCETYADACRVTGVRRHPFTHAGRAWKISPYGGRLRGLTGDVITPHPRRTNPSVTPLRAATAPLSGEPRGGQKSAAFTHLFTTMPHPTFR